MEAVSWQEKESPMMREEEEKGVRGKVENADEWRREGGCYGN